MVAVRTFLLAWTCRVSTNFMLKCRYPGARLASVVRVYPVSEAPVVSALFFASASTTVSDARKARLGTVAAKLTAHLSGG